MKKLKVLFTVFTIILMVGSSVVSAQGKLGVVGKLMPEHEAKVLFGKVIGSIDIPAQDLRDALKNDKEYVLFTIKNNRVVIRDEKKKSLSEENEYLDDNDVLYVFSKSQVEQLLNFAKPRKSKGFTAMATTDPVVTFEVRASVLTLTAGATTLEMSALCPPICPD